MGLAILGALWREFPDCVVRVGALHLFPGHAGDLAAPLTCKQDDLEQGTEDPRDPVQRTPQTLQLIVRENALARARPERGSDSRGRARRDQVLLQAPAEELREIGK